MDQKSYVRGVEVINTYVVLPLISYFVCFNEFFCANMCKI